MMFRNVYRNFNIFSRHMAGHSKWANIRHIKGAKDAERATLFQKLSRQMKAMIRGKKKNLLRVLKITTKIC